MNSCSRTANVAPPFTATLLYMKWDIGKLVAMTTVQQQTLAMIAHVVISWIVHLANTGLACYIRLHPCTDKFVPR